MLSKVTLLTAALAFVNAIAIPNGASEELAKRGPQPLKLDFEVVTKVGNVSLKDFWKSVRAAQGKRATGTLIVDLNDVSYQINTYLGLDSQYINSALDTGLSDLWVFGPGQAELGLGEYNPGKSSTSQNTHIPFEIAYLDNSNAQGLYYLDSFGFQPGNPILNSFQFAVATQASMLGLTGILGIADKDQEAIDGPTYDNLPWALANNGVTPKASYSLYLGSEAGKQGSIIFGGIDTAKYSGLLEKYPRTGRGQGINVASITVNGRVFNQNRDFILDSGTSWNLFPYDVVAALDAVFKPIVLLGTRFVNCNQPNNKYVTFNFGKNSINVSYKALVVEQQGQCFLGYQPEVQNTYILGDAFLRSAYVYYDLTDRQIGIAQASYSSNSNIISA